MFKGIRRNEQMIEQLFNLLDGLAERERTIEQVLETLGGDGNRGFLLDEIDMVELMIVKAYGGNDGHYKHIDSTELFYNYEHYEGEEHKTELIDYIKLTIENDWTDEVKHTFIRA